MSDKITDIVMQIEKKEDIQQSQTTMNSKKEGI